MCPICIATAAWLSAGAGSAGGLTALLANKHQSKLHSKTDLHRTDGAIFKIDAVRVILTSAVVCFERLTRSFRCR
jgi:hypothetical protein